MLTQNQVATLQSIIKNKGDCTNINCDVCPFTLVNQESSCEFIANGADKYSDEQVVKRCKELLNAEGIVTD